MIFFLDEVKWVHRFDVSFCFWDEKINMMKKRLSLIKKTYNRNRLFKSIFTLDALYAFISTKTKLHKHTIEKTRKKKITQINDTKKIAAHSALYNLVCLLCVRLQLIWLLFLSFRLKKNDSENKNHENNQRN